MLGISSGKGDVNKPPYYGGYLLPKIQSLKLGNAYFGSTKRLVKL
jgi:hypothetical protein